MMFEVPSNPSHPIILRYTQDWFCLLGAVLVQLCFPSVILKLEVFLPSEIKKKILKTNKTKKPNQNTPVG